MTQPSRHTISKALLHSTIYRIMRVEEFGYILLHLSMHFNENNSNSSSLHQAVSQQAFRSGPQVAVPVRILNDIENQIKGRAKFTGLTNSMDKEIQELLAIKTYKTITGDLIYLLRVQQFLAADTLSSCLSFDEALNLATNPAKKEGDCE